MSWIFVDKEKEGGSEQMRSQMRSQMRRGGYRSSGYRFDGSNRNEFEEGYRHGYRHGWEDSEDEGMSGERNRNRY